MDQAVVTDHDSPQVTGNSEIPEGGLAIFSDKTKKIAILIVVALALVAGVAVAYAAGGRGRGPAETLMFDLQLSK